MAARTLRIATWNVNGLRARAERVAAWLDAAEPDIVLLQETKCDPSQIPEGLFSTRSYEVAALGAGGRNGVLIASRHGLSEVQESIADYAPKNHDESLPDLLSEPRLISAVCGGLRVASVYAPNGREVDAPHFHAKLHWYGALRAWSAERITESAPLLLGGDFNVAPTDADVWDPAALVGATHVTPRERDAWNALVGLGLMDAAQAVVADGERAPFTWWDYRGGAFHRGWGMRIDHLLVEPRAGSIVTSSVDRDGRKGESPSDHVALMIDLAQPA
jgi:exodeoxyribonuclease-3